MPQITVHMSDVEAAVLHRLSREADIPQDRVFIQALRLYHQHRERLKDGETVSWSGDAQRAREFAGPLADTNDD